MSAKPDFLLNWDFKIKNVITCNFWGFDFRKYIFATGRCKDTDLLRTKFDEYMLMQTVYCHEKFFKVKFKKKKLFFKCKFPKIMCILNGIQALNILIKDYSVVIQVIKCKSHEKNNTVVKIAPPSKNIVLLFGQLEKVVISISVPN